MFELNPTHQQILTQAAGRADGAVLPLPEGLRIRGGALTRMLDKLAAEQLIELPSAGSAGPASYRITKEGRHAVGAVDPEPVGDGLPRSPRQGTRLAQIALQLSAEDGVTLQQLEGLTGWQPHSLRAALTGLRQRGMVVQRWRTAEGVTLYRITTPEPATEAAAR